MKELQNNILKIANINFSETSIIGNRYTINNMYNIV